MNPLIVLAGLAWLMWPRRSPRRRNPRRRNPTSWYPYRDSEAPGVRRESIGNEPDYDNRNLGRALEWASRAKWGAMRVDLPGKKYRQSMGEGEAQRELEAFRDQAAALGYRLSDVRYGRGDRTWRFRVHKERPRQLGLFNPRRMCRCGSGAVCRPNPYTTACRIGPGHVYDFRAGGRCQCCGRAAPKRLVTLEWDAGGETHYGRRCAARAIGTTKLRTNQLEHMDREAQREAEQAKRYRGVGRAAARESGVQRPPWAIGLSERQIIDLARDAGASPYTPKWWQGVRMETGRGEMQDVLSYARLGRGAREGRPGRGAPRARRAEAATRSRARYRPPEDLPF